MDTEPPADDEDDGEYVCGPCQSGKHGASCRDWSCSCCEGEGRLTLQLGSPFAWHESVRLVHGRARAVGVALVPDECPVWVLAH